MFEFIGSSDSTVKVWDIIKQYYTHNFKRLLWCGKVSQISDFLINSNSGGKYYYTRQAFVETSSSWVNHSSRWGIRQLGILFCSVFPPFSSWGNSQRPEFPALNDTPARQFLFHHEYHQKIFLQSSLVAIGSVVSQPDLSCKG